MSAASSAALPTAWTAPGRGAGAAGGAADAERVFAPIYRRADRWMGWLVAFHVLLAGALAPVYDTWRVTLLVGGAAALAFAACRWARPGSHLTRCMAGVSLQAFCALHIYQMRGLAEMHFFFFTAVTAMILYEDGRALWPGVWAIIAQHSLFAYWHDQGVHPGGQHFFEPDHVGLVKIGFHFGIALLHVGIASTCATALRRQTLRDAAQRGALQDANARLRHQTADLERSNERLQQHAEDLEVKTAALQATTEEAEHANAAKAQFLTTMSHELRTPLNAIGGYADLLALGVYGAMSDAQRDSVGRIKRSGQHLLSLINDILNFAKLEAGHVEVRVAPVDVGAVAAGLEALVAPQLADKRLAYTCDARTGGVWALADAEKLQQVLLNLLTNAVKFTEAGGRVALTCVVAGDRVVVRVADTGRGIPPDQIERVFEPFLQIDRHRTHESQQGVGLGLAISRDLARAMGGELTAESAVGAGSTFTLTLSVAAGD